MIDEPESMVAGAGGDYSPLLLGGWKQKESITGTALFERARALEMVPFAHDSRAGGSTVRNQLRAR